VNSDVIVVFGVVNAGMLLVLYGTVAKNRWGINLHPVACPRCNTPFPRLRNPQNVRHALWGGSICAKCQTEVDKWGREVAGPSSVHPPGDAQSEGSARRIGKGALLARASVGFFCISLLFGWLGLGDHPSTFIGWMAFAAIAGLEAALFGVLFVGSVCVLERVGRGVRSRHG
jgi:hypothetical protein